MNFPDTQPRANILIAYPYWSDANVENVRRGGDNIRLLVDSGAFTAWKAGKPIALDDYCRFIEKLPVQPWRYFTLDVIGDAAASMRNYETMLKRGFRPVPIFTRGEHPSVLEDYYKSSDVVGIGGLVGTLKAKGFVNGIMKRVGKRRVHWLGFTSMDYLKFYRPYMCDSSTWESGGRFGTIKLYMGSGRYETIHKERCQEPLSSDVADRIRSFGIEPTSLRNKDAWHGGVSINRRLCAASALALSLDVQRNLGTLMFNAIAESTRGVPLFLEAFERQARSRPALTESA